MVFQDIESLYVGEDLIPPSPVPSSWKANSHLILPAAWIPHLMTNNIDFKHRLYASYHPNLANQR